GVLSPSAGVLYSGSVCVFAPSSCLLTLLPNGTIHSLNNPFSSLLFGYNSSQLLGKNVTYLIPAFYERVRAAERTDQPASHPRDASIPSDSHMDPCRCSASANCPPREVLTLTTDMLSTKDDQQETCSEFLLLLLNTQLNYIAVP
ncbi:hypothetical protein PO909_031378, partial [Leuciscus waleckii]